MGHNLITRIKQLVGSAENDDVDADDDNFDEQAPRRLSRPRGEREEESVVEHAGRRRHPRERFANRRESDRSGEHSRG